MLSFGAALEEVRKYNRHHGKDGRFTFAPETGHGSGGSRGSEEGARVPSSTARWMGFTSATVVADFDALQRRHPEHFKSADEVRSAVNYVLEKPDDWFPHSAGKAMIFRNAEGRSPAMRIKVSGDGAGHLRVVSAYRLTRNEIARRMKSKAKWIEDRRGSGSISPSPTVADFLREVGLPNTPYGGLRQSSRTSVPNSAPKVKKMTAISFVEALGKDLTAGDVHMDTAMGNPPKKPGRLSRWKKERMAKAISLSGRTLYVRRNLTKESASAFTAWAKSQGFTNLTPPDDLHVTIVYSRGAKPNLPDSFDHVQFSNTEGRAVEPLGDKGAVVLRFPASDLEERWRQACELGATWDYPTGYKPHVTITYDGSGVDLSKVTPFQGTLKFGPEVHEPINENWAEDKGLRKLLGLTVAKAAPTGKELWAWASTIEVDGKPVIDSQGDVIELAELEKAADRYMSESRDVGLMHETTGHGRVVQSMVFTKELQAALGIDLGRVGWLVKMEISDPAMQKRIASGEIRQLSIGGSGRRERI